MAKRVLLLAAVLLAGACGAQPSASQLPTADIQLKQPLAAPPRLAVPATPSIPASPTLAADPPAPLAAPAPATALDQYHAWMIEARELHPYSESIDTMWQLMLCESSGDPNAAADVHQGLFQYDVATWAGEWNPYRDQPILDPHAQILATAKAWHDGNQGWWGCYHG